MPVLMRVWGDGQSHTAGAVTNRLKCLKNHLAVHHKRFLNVHILCFENFLKNLSWEYGAKKRGWLKHYTQRSNATVTPLPMTLCLLLPQVPPPLKSLPQAPASTWTPRRAVSPTESLLSRLKSWGWFYKGPWIPTKASQRAVPLGLQSRHVLQGPTWL